MLRINGERIYLRDHLIGDTYTFHAWMTDPLITKYLSSHSDSMEQSSKLLKHAINQVNAIPRKDYFLAIVQVGTENVIGEAGFSIQSTAEKDGVAEMGYFLFPKYWGKGYATEAAALMIQFCFSELKLHKVTAGCDIRNTASEKVMIHCGMQKEAHFKQHRFIDGIWADRVEYAILRQDRMNKQ
jgi:[ribosomal protein S5]-alanine N-acetyltransferase